MTGGNFKNELGLIAGHAYSFIGTNTYKGEKLVKLRNPWGHEAYNGPWSDHESPSKWTDDAKAKLGHSVLKDGTFWMRNSDFHKTFFVTVVGEYRDW